MMEPLSGLSEFISVLAQLKYGERSPYPFYCALLYTVAEGVDADLARFVDQHWEELDGMTGGNCLVFVVGDARPEAAAGHRAFAAAEVYRVADELGVRASALPCAAFFVEPDESRDVLRLRLADYLFDAEPASMSGMTAGFRGIATALSRCSSLDRDAGLDCLRDELVRERARLLGARGASASEHLESAAATTATLEKVVVSGATIASTVLGVFGIAL